MSLAQNCRVALRVAETKQKTLEGVSNSDFSKYACNRLVCNKKEVFDFKWLLN